MMVDAELAPDRVAALIAGAGAGAWTRTHDPRFAAHVGVAAGIVVTLLPDGETLMQTKRAIKGACTPAGHLVEALEARLDGVRVYVMAAAEGAPVRIVISRRDLTL